MTTTARALAHLAAWRASPTPEAFSALDAALDDPIAAAQLDAFSRWLDAARAAALARAAHARGKWSVPVSEWAPVVRRMLEAEEAERIAEREWVEAGCFLPGRVG